MFFGYFMTRRKWISDC